MGFKERAKLLNDFFTRQGNNSSELPSVTKKTSKSLSTIEILRYDKLKK